MSLNLSKSKYCSAVQCPKMLWLKKNKPEEFDESVMNQTVLDNGNKVGDLAMGMFGDFVEVPFGDFGGMITKTKELIDSGEKIIAEASFAYDGLFCSVDILKNLGGNKVELYEVKSSTEIKEIYLDDVAYQRYVLAMLGYDVVKVCLIYINNNYVRHGELNLDELFNIEDVTLIAESKHQEVEDYVAQLTEYMKQVEEPNDDIGVHCRNPYDCGFFKYCSKHLPVPNVFDIAGLWFSKKVECYYNGIVTFEQLNGYDKLNVKQYMQVEHELYNYPARIDKENIKQFLEKISCPIYFLDFESFQSPIPPFDDSKPYEQLVFQYSLHYLEAEDGELKHKAFLAYPGADPRRKLAEQLCEDIPKDVCVTAYNRSFERTCIKRLAEIYPDLAEHLMNIHDNIVDLMIPFQKRYYYTKAMEGSYSIKYVLPALFPDEPELDYHNLEGVHNGQEASATFIKMAEMDVVTLEEYREHLLNYCKLDTYAMVKVWEKLKEAVK